jgi:hypothetical protein
MMRKRNKRSSRLYTRTMMKMRYMSARTSRRRCLNKRPKRAKEIPTTSKRSQVGRHSSNNSKPWTKISKMNSSN